MFRRLVSLALASVLLIESTACFAAERLGGVENPAMEVARSTFWGAVAGTVVGLAVAAIQNDNQSEAIRWGFALGTFSGLGAGIYFVSNRPQPASVLELRDGQLVPNPGAMAAFEVTRDGLRARAVGVRF